MKFKHYTKFHSILGQMKGIIAVDPDKKTKLLTDLIKEIDEVFLEAVGEHKPKSEVKESKQMELGGIKHKIEEETPEDKEMSKVVKK